MVEGLDKASQILKKYNQEHLISFYNDLDDDKKQFLVNQICSINFEQIFNLYEASKIDEIIPTNIIEPLPYIDKTKLSNSDVNYFENVGCNIIKDNKFAVVTMAGGQGTRLGYKGPKGSFMLDIEPKKSLFEIVCDYLKSANSKFGVTINWYIMTSIYNNSDTIAFFENNDYFGYDKNYIKFFKQSQLPLVDIFGNLILEEIYKIKEASNGNGDVFNSLNKYGIIDDMKSKKVEWVFFAGVDNVLLDPTDTLFLGLTDNSNYVVGSKTLLKKDPNSKDWVFARRNGKPSIINSCNLTDEMKNLKDKYGNYLYRDINMLAHLFNISALDTLCNKELPYHRAFKKNPFVNDEGMKQVPDSPNTFKFETFIFDSFGFFDDIQLLRVEEDKEFAPIKDFNGPHNPEVAKILYEENILK